jgi:DNA polymerase III epsilon subunit-like protein
MAVAEAASNVIVIDTETTGLPAETRYGGLYVPTNYSKYNSSRVIEIGYFIYSKEGDFITKQNMLIMPDGFRIENTAIHGIKHEVAEREGIPLQIALAQLEEDLKTCDTIVAHNLQFDFNVILAECFRILANGANTTAKSVINRMDKLKRVCTMQLGMQKLHRERRIKLSHLYEELTDNEWNQQHRAEDDARVCAECYWILVKM